MDLATVKKGTPLYGQPSWWGEEEEDLKRDQANHKESSTPGRRKRPDSLVLSGDEADALVGGTDGVPGGNLSNKNSAMEKAERVERAKPTYMEISLKDDPPDSSPDDGGDLSKADTLTPATPYSKDSLSNSPDVKQPSKAAASFTIELDDDPEHPPTKKALNIGSSLSEFVPSKIRRNFRERKDRASRMGSKESTPSKTSEERELSPMHQRKIDEIWTVVESKGKGTHAPTVAPSSSRLATQGAASSLRSPNLGEIEKLSEVSDGSLERKGKRASGVAASSHQISRASAAKRNSKSPVSALASGSAHVSVSQYSDPTSYLIDKMFEGGSDVSSAAGEDKEIPTEQTMYKEAAKHSSHKPPSASGAAKRSSTATRSGSSSSFTAAVAAVAKSKTNPAAPSGVRRNSSDRDPASATRSGKITSNSVQQNQRSKAVASSVQSATSRTPVKPALQQKSDSKNICDKTENRKKDDTFDDDDEYDNNDDDDLQITEDNSVDGEGENIVISSKDHKEDKDDKASEAGTYTIEADEKEGEEEEEARKRIDVVFGVDVDDFTNENPVINPLRMASPGGYDNVCIDVEDGEKTPEDGEEDDEEEGTRKLSEENFDDDDDDDLDDVDDLHLDEDFDDENPDMSSADGVQTWVSQLTALASHKTGASHEGKHSKEDGDTALTKKPPQASKGKRPGTGRKLPSIPTDRSPVSSEHSSHIGDQDLIIGDEIMSERGSSELGGSVGPSPEAFSLSSGRATNTNGVSAVNGKYGGNRISSQSQNSQQRTVRNGHSEAYGKQNGVTAASPNQSVRSGRSARSARSHGSVDTELLLQDTETVMAAMEARMAYKSNKRHNNSRSHSGDGDSDTDVSSTVALVNGDEDYVKPTLYKSPRDALARRAQRDASLTKSHSLSLHNSSQSNNTSSNKRPLSKSYSQAQAGSKSRTPVSPRTAASPRTPTSLVSGGYSNRKSLVSDVYSHRSESMDGDSISDFGSDAGDSTISRTSSKGKGTISMAKPNRAFQLRRARADSCEEPTTPRSGKSVASSRSSIGSTARSSSVHTSSRVRSSLTMDTGRSEGTSLGAQIVRKSRSNAGQDMHKSSSSKTNNNTNPNLNRTDGGRHSLRLQRASSLTIAQPTISSSNYKKETSPAKTLSRTTPTSLKNLKGNLSVTGVGSGGASSRSGTQSQPGSRSNSPKAAERMAWKRRKEYDPRKAVAEAKAKAKDKDVTGSSTNQVTLRPKPSASSSMKRRMIRSASFTNSGELSLSSTNSSVSASQDFGVTPRSDHHYEHEGFRRAFLPFHTTLTSGRFSQSADEEDAVAKVDNSARTFASLTVSSEPKSAFTPPPFFKIGGSPNTSLSPQSANLAASLTASMNGLSILRRSATFNGAGDTGGADSVPSNGEPIGDDLKTSVNGDLGDGRSPIISSPAVPQNSYDSLIVSSVYQLSLKLKTTMDKSLEKLRDQSRVSHTPSPIDDFLSDPGKGEITAWKSANQELAGALKNLRKIERHVEMINSVLFPDKDEASEVSAGLSTVRQGKQRYFQEIERIRSELAGFHPIGHGKEEEPENVSPEMAELSETF